MKPSLPGPSARPQSTSKRDETVDALKFLAISLVVVQHLLNLRPEFKTLAPGLVPAIVSFNMPLFVFMSGYVLVGRERHHAWEFVRQRALALLVPYVAWILVVMPIRHFTLAEMLPRLGEALINPHRGFQMWFLLVLFWTLVIFRVGFAISRKTPWLVAFGIGMTLLMLMARGVPAGVDKVAWLFPFLVAGFVVSRHRSTLCPAALVAALVGIAWFAYAAVNAFPSEWRYVTAFAGIAGTWGAYRLLPEPVVRWQALAGKRSLGIYGSQMVVFPFALVGTGWWGAILSFVTITTASLALTWVLERTWLTRSVFLGAGFKHTARA